MSRLTRLSRARVRHRRGSGRGRLDVSDQRGDPRDGLRLIGCGYRYLTVDEDVTSDEYRRINPAGTVPALVDGDLVLYETIAILMHLADRFPDAQLVPAVATAQRGLYYRWLAYTASNLMTAFYRWFHVDRMIDGEEHQRALRRGAKRDLAAIGSRIEAELGDRQWPLSEAPMMPDILLGVVASWGAEIDGADVGGPRLAALIERVAAL
jgi:glutathione S-transferase